MRCESYSAGSPASFGRRSGQPKTGGRTSVGDSRRLGVLPRFARSDRACRPPRKSRCPSRTPVPASSTRSVTASPNSRIGLAEPDSGLARIHRNELASWARMRAIRALAPARAQLRTNGCAPSRARRRLRLISPRIPICFVRSVDPGLGRNGPPRGMRADNLQDLGLGQQPIAPLGFLEDGLDQGGLRRDAMLLQPENDV